MNKPWYKSKTKTGALILGLGQLWPTLCAVVPPLAPFAAGAALINAIGMVVTGAGVRNAIDKGK